MSVFKYTVANREGKKLSGSVEAPDEKTAREELNNLGFSILSLQETREQISTQGQGPRFVFEAIDKNSKLVTGTIPAKEEREAFEKLQTQYGLTVSAIWKEGSSQEDIAAAKQKGTQALQDQLKAVEKKDENQILAAKKQEQFVRAKIETILKDVHELLQNYDQELPPPQKSEINKRIDKLLRIKHSTNLDHVLSAAEDLLHYVHDQEKFLSEKTLEDKRFQYKIKTQKLLNQLKQQQEGKSLSEDIVQRIEGWQQEHMIPGKDPGGFTKFENKFLSKIKEFFETPPEIKALKAEIKTYNKQLVEFAKLYFKEPTPEYKTKVKNSIKIIWQKRKEAKSKIKQIKKDLKEKKRASKIGENFLISFVGELNALTGWLLAFYIAYYFISLYLQTKDFGLTQVPKGFLVYESHLFKYILVTLFLLHATTAIKLNFFKKSLIANIILPPIFVFGTIISILNF